jgi:hypothetical protein
VKRLILSAVRVNYNTGVHMNNHDADRELELGRFGEYLLKSRVVPEKYAPYYVRWVRRFMVQVPDRPGLGFEDTLSIFLNTLRAQIEPWQLDQAEKAVRLYFSHYRNLSATETTVTEIKADTSGCVSKVAVMDATRTLIRLRHYPASLTPPRPAKSIRRSSPRLVQHRVTRRASVTCQHFQCWPLSLSQN